MCVKVITPVPDAGSAIICVRVRILVVNGYVLLEGLTTALCAA